MILTWAWLCSHKSSLQKQACWPTGYGLLNSELDDHLLRSWEKSGMVSKLKQGWSTRLHDSWTPFQPDIFEKGHSSTNWPITIVWEYILVVSRGLPALGFGVPKSSRWDQASSVSLGGERSARTTQTSLSDPSGLVSHMNLPKLLWGCLYAYSCHSRRQWALWVYKSLNLGAKSYFKFYLH